MTREGLARAWGMTFAGLMMFGMLALWVGTALADNNGTLALSIQLPFESVSEAKVIKEAA